jgi:hypothetical protein
MTNSSDLFVVDCGLSGRTASFRSDWLVSEDASFDGPIL